MDIMSLTYIKSDFFSFLVYNVIVMNMFEAINSFINSTIDYLGVAGPILGCVLILCESMIPILPLCVFITLNCLTFGNLLGFIISWVFTCLGCLISFKICDSKLKNWCEKKLRKNASVDKMLHTFENCKLSTLAVIVAIPFTPAFAVNIAAGLSKMETKKFMTGICIGKIFMVYFWAFVGTSLIQSLTNPYILIRVAVMVIVAYVLSKVVTKKFGL